MHPLRRKNFFPKVTVHQIISLIVTMFLALNIVYADALVKEDVTIDRLQLVSQQITLLKNRLDQSVKEQIKQKEADANPKVSKKVLDKITLDISVSQSNLDSLNIEVADCQQTINWLGKSIQEIENQINVLNIFGLDSHKLNNNISVLQSDLKYQIKLLELEKIRITYLKDLQINATTNLKLKQDKFATLDSMLQSKQLLHLKQQQVKDELAYQEQQNRWLQELNNLYGKIATVDPVLSHVEYAGLERDIFFANESANVAYSQSLIARYRDQIQQMKLAILHGNSISLLNEIRDQLQTLTNQISRLDSVLQLRIEVVKKHISYLSQRKADDALQDYIKKLQFIESEYRLSDRSLVLLTKSLQDFRVSLDKALQAELSSRQGFPVFSRKALLDVGKEILLIPTLTFQVMKSLSGYMIKAIENTTILGWVLFVVIESLVILAFINLRRLLSRIISSSEAQLENQLNLKWIGLQILWRNYIDIFLIGCILGGMFYFKIPVKNFIFIVYISLVWLVFKAILVVARVSLIETLHDAAGHDTRLFYRLKWMIIIGGLITAITVFVNQLPLIYEIKTLFDRMFLVLMMVISILLLRSWDVVPNLILSHTVRPHPYLRRSIRIVGLLIPILIFVNSLIGLMGFVNLIMTVAWYEGIFLMVLVCYLILRGLLSDGLEFLSRIMIQYVNNGWLWTEAFLKPLDKVLRITLFLVAWTVLFLLYGWDKQSPIVERLTRLLHYKLVSVLNTTITPLHIIELVIVISVFYWTAKWTREFVYRLLLSRTKDLGIRNSIAILSQYSIVGLGIFISLQVLGIDLRALAVVTGMFLFGIGFGLRDLASNFACGFLILLERPLRVGDIVTINNVEGDVTHIGSRAITIRTWDMMEHMVPNAEVFNKAFTNWTAKDNIVRCVLLVKVCRHDNPHDIKHLIQEVISSQKDILKEPISDIYLKEINDAVMTFELRFYVNIRLVKSRVGVASALLMTLWDTFEKHGIKPPYPKQEIFIRRME